MEGMHKYRWEIEVSARSDSTETKFSEIVALIFWCMSILTDFCSNAYYSPHTHAGVTTHLIRRGSLTISYPEDNDKTSNGQAKKVTFGVGERIDVPAGKVHEVWIGDEGCEYVIGE
jgi:hypothetical protein